ncbi:MAG: hypothetical protein AAGI13_06265, partial [Pseudomonadota bacterium]
VETQEVSKAMANLSLIPRIKAAESGTVVVAPGTSCRHQIADLADRAAVHPITLLAESLDAA